MNDHFLNKKLEERSASGSLRSLRLNGKQTDFYSNDYLGIAKQGLIEGALKGKSYSHGSTGSRLLAGNNSLTEETEKKIALFHESPAALIFNSGYDANFGLLSCIAKKDDLILYDKLSHASIRDGIRQSFAHSSSFAHNDTDDLEKKLKNRVIAPHGICFVVTESVFSMDGYQAPLTAIASLCERYEAQLIVDEAHATGILGENGSGLVQLLNLQQSCFARIHTFGKALGCHGAVVLGSQRLRDYLINFCRPFIYSTALPAVSVAAIDACYSLFPQMKDQRAHIQKLVALFDLPGFKKSDTAIQCYVVPGNGEVKKLAGILLDHNFDIRPILYPTVPLGAERLRIALHSFNSAEETEKLISIICAQ